MLGANIVGEVCRLTTTMLSDAAASRFLPGLGGVVRLRALPPICLDHPPTGYCGELGNEIINFTRFWHCF